MAQATAPLADYARRARKESVVVTMRGKPIATVTAVPRGADWESVAIGSNPKFLKIMEQSRLAHRRRGGLSSDEMRRQLGIEPRPKAKRKR
jgi:antitoxin (DNA-binding transcriptional repressor) of toxin-antitoxin stability system